MFGHYKIPFKLDIENTLLETKRIGANSYYHRIQNDDVVEKLIVAKKQNRILINPVEPVNTPRKITTVLMIEFERPNVIEPKMIKKIYLKFPIEIGIYIVSKTDYNVLDIITFEKQKYSLYGEHRTGSICRYWKSKTYSKQPKVDLIHEGVMELNIINHTKNWVELNQAVFNACGMCLYYNKNLISMKARMEIIHENYAETEFISQPLIKGMAKSLELFTPKTVSVFTPKFSMVGSV